MKTAIVGIEKRLRLAGLLLVVGLLVEAICLLWARPIAFILLVVVGGLLCVLPGLLCISIRWFPPARQTRTDKALR